MGRVAEMGCALCRHLGFGATPAELHHPRSNAGIGQRASHMDVIPLCYEHHRGATGLHGLGKRAFEREYGLSELDLLELTKQSMETL